MTTKINASTAGLTETVDASGILELQTANTAALIIDASQNANFVSTGAITVPVGTTAQRPTGVNGMIRYNSNTAAFEFYANNTWTGANVTPPAVISVAPVISGSAVVGQNLTSTTGTWTGSVTGYYYQWLANSTAISNATANVFTLTSTQNNTNITCNVTAYNIAGNSTPSTSNTLGPVTSTYLINKSLRFRSAATAYLNRTPASASSRTTWTWSGWVKRGKLGGYQSLFAAGTSSNTDITFHNASDSYGIDFGVYSGGYLGRKLTSALYRDTAAWYHVVAVYDSTNATAGNRMRLYVNGVQVTAFAVSTDPSQNLAADVNNTVAHNIGNNPAASYPLDGYLAEVNFIDGQALTPSSFGQTDTTTGAWIPNAYNGSYGTNGFYLPFSNTTSTTTLGYDSSGNGNNWTTNNISLTAGSTYDSMTDVPTLTSANASNYCVVNPLSSTATPTNGNLAGTIPANKTMFGSFAIPSTGKWYFEAIMTNAANLNVGLAIYVTSAAAVYNISSSVLYSASGVKNVDNVLDQPYGASFAAGDVIGVAANADAGTITFYKNNTSQGAITHTIGGLFPAFGNGGNSTDFTVNFGQQPFTYTPPTGFVALNAYNL